MPTYEYRCTACHVTYERREGFDAPAQQDCPECGGLARRVLHAPPIIFKGSGFYTTDYKRAGNGNGSHSSEGDHGHSHSESSEESVASS